MQAVVPAKCWLAVVSGSGPTPASNHKFCCGYSAGGSNASDGSGSTVGMVRRGGAWSADWTRPMAALGHALLVSCDVESQTYIDIHEIHRLPCIGSTASSRGLVKATDTSGIALVINVTTCQVAASMIVSCNKSILCKYMYVQRLQYIRGDPHAQRPKLAPLQLQPAGFLSPDPVFFLVFRHHVPLLPTFLSPSHHHHHPVLACSTSTSQRPEQVAYH